MHKTVSDVLTIELAQRALGEISAHLPNDLDYATAVDGLAAILRGLEVTAEPDPAL
jgi:hypothetical protein